MTTKLTDVASVIRSKNAGPYELTLDVSFSDRGTDEKVVAADAIDAALISRLSHIDMSDVLELVAFEPAAAVKITIRRPRVAGDIEETDVYGAQRHAPLLTVVLDLGSYWRTCVVLLQIHTGAAGGGWRPTIRR